MTLPGLENSLLRTLLLVDDDVTYCTVLAKALARRGFVVSVANNVNEAIQMIAQNLPTHAVVDLKMPGQSGLTLVAYIKERKSDARIVVLTGYSSIATAVEAVKLGATYYLAKPADADEIVAAFDHQPGVAEAAIVTKPMSMDRLEWEHLQKVLADCGGNISAAARTLNMHRRTLQRKLLKHPAPERGDRLLAQKK
ncbi:response regulator transcription factor [Candidatus Nitrotoga sp. M5]|uniref:response regulator transcription factor n=1 Tax=Candidatus Nitrotoga sp. M5 TaxID=2890409 RepID=UPI001EF58279|nr:response regulator transcription factor [Candidatus Nitrotoga sp. M5]CAH1387293.1 Acid tolerance regulatory protein ActR [Candidatus Nitrotoga sp. M5]